MKKIEKLNKMRYKAINGEEEYMFIACVGKGAVAAMNGSAETRIKNAVIIAQGEDGYMIWSVKKGYVVQCPQKIVLSTKNMQRLVGFIGDIENEQDYFSFGDSDGIDPKIKYLIGVVEISGYCSAFLFNWNDKMVYSIEEDIWGNQDSHLFVLLEAMWNLERRNQVGQRSGQCSEEEYGYESGWEKEMQESSWSEEMQESSWEENR